MLDQVAIKRMDDEIQAEIRAAFDFAEISPFPESARAFEGIFAERAGPND